MPLGTISCDGSGIRMAQELGARVGSMDSVTAWRSISPPESFVKGVVINQNGQRFVAEDTYLGHLGCAIARQPQQKAWLIIDAHTYWHAFKETLPSWGVESYLEFKAPLLVNLIFNKTKGKTISELADKLGLDQAKVINEIGEYNKLYQSDEDPFSKQATNIKPLIKGPFYAIDISIANRWLPCPSIPMGGLCVDELTGQVINNNNDKIPGLYAAGRVAVGIPSGAYVAGLALGDCVFSGRRAGKAVATSGVSS